MDKATIDALDEFSINCLDKKLFLKNFKIPNYDKNLDQIIHDTALIGLLEKHGFKTLQDIRKIGIEALYKNIEYMGFKKVIYLTKDITIASRKSNNNNHETEYLDSLTDTEITEILEKNDAKKYLFKDPRFAEIYFNFPLMPDDGINDLYSWHEAFINLFQSGVSASNEIQKLLHHFSDISAEISDLTLEQQMDHIFTIDKNVKS